MNTIREISTLSEYRPDNGDLLHIFDLLNSDLTRSEAMAIWGRTGKSDDQFRTVYKRLKDRLLKGMLTHSFKEFEQHQQRRISCYQKFTEVKTLLIVGKRASAMDLAAELMREAERCGLYDVAGLLARDLAYLYGSLNIDMRKYRRYRRKARLLWEDLNHEKRAQELFAEIVFLVNKKRDFSHLEAEIEAMTNIQSKSPKFNLYRYSFLLFWHRVRNEHTAIMQTCTEAVDYFESANAPLPYTTQWNFYRQMIPYLIEAKDFVLAEVKIKNCLSLPVLGSHNWHISMFQYAMLGFRSSKPKMALWAYKLAMEHETDSISIREHWDIVHAYLKICELLGEVELEQQFRLRKFINSVEFPRLSAQVAVMVYLLLSDQKKEYMREAERVPDMLKKEKSSRGRCMLRMLAKVEKGDYYRIRVSAMAKRDWNALKRTPRTVSVRLIDDEVFEFEVLWATVLDCLR